MAAGTPVLWSPPDGETGVPLDSILVCLKSAYSGAGTQREARWRIRLAADASVVWDSLLRENDDLSQGDDWIDIPLAHVPLEPSTSYTIGVLVRNTSNESSSESTVHTFTTAAAPVTSATFRAAA